MGGATNFGEVRLAWARDRSGARVHVGELDPARRRERAPFTCPGCGEALVARLGKVRARHFGHHPGSRCPLTAPETALHWNAKERLLVLCEEAFAGRLRLELRARCPACRRVAPRPLADLGDVACAEGTVGSRRCDVLVSRAGRPALALEVRVTHGLPEEKASALASAGLQVLELDARAEWWRAAEGGAGIELLPVRSLGFEPCPACQVAERARREREAGGDAAAVAELEAYRARGLLGPRPGPPLVDAPPPIPDPEFFSLLEEFRCPECKGSELLRSDRIVRHRCPSKEAPRTVAWMGYDGQLVRLGWWKAR